MCDYVQNRLFAIRKETSVARNERLNTLLSILQLRNGASIKELAVELGVTEMTVRRDMRMLCERGLADLVHGVAIYRPGQAGLNKYMYDLQHAQTENIREKEKIGAAAARMIEPGEIVFLDVGTTAACVARALPDNLRITAMCFSMNTLLEVLQKNVGQIIMSGGFYHQETQAFSCNEMIGMMKERRTTKAFVVPSGASMELGLTCYSPHEVEIKRMGLTNSLHRILLLDSSKFGKVRANCFGDWSQVDTVITDEGIPAEWREFLQEKKISLSVV